MRSPASASCRRHCSARVIGSVADIVVVGSLHLDIMVHAPGRPLLGETMVGQGWAMRPGGKGGNQAVAAARHGARTAMAGLVGEDDFGVRLRDNLVARGVDAAAVAIRAGAASGMSVALVEPSGDYGAVIVSGVNLALDEAALAPWRGLIQGARWLLLQNEVPEAANIAAAGMARGGGARVLLNAAPARALSPALAMLLDILVVNALEAESLCGMAVPDLDTAARAAERLAAVVPCAIVTAGGEGVATANRGSAARMVRPHRVAVVSTHGAGDAFVGALAARLAMGDGLDLAVRYANAAAALLVGDPDEARGNPGPDEVARLLAGEAGE